MDNALIDRYHLVEETRIQACKDNNRDPASVQLLAVSKFQPAEAIFALYTLGHRLFGENYVQEAEKKSKFLQEKDIDSKEIFHMIGSVQRKKASHVVGNFALIHSVDSIDLACAFERVAAQKNCIQNILLEVNVGNEEQKAGVHKDNVAALANDILRLCPHLRMQGLMCLPPVYGEGELARPYFALLRKLRDMLRQQTGLPLPELSMGMSGDFPYAIAEGATIIRIGTAIFGERPKKVY